MPEMYRCAACNRTFETGWTDEDASAEAEANFGKPAHAPGMVVVCDDCYQQMVAWMTPAAFRKQVH